MPTKKTPAPEDPAAPKPKPPRKAGAGTGKAAKAHPDSLTTDDDRVFMGEAVLPIVERDGPLLLALAEKSFPGLEEAEKRFFRNLGIVYFGGELPDEDDETKTLRADRLAWALLDRRALRLLTPLGVMVRGANITGQLQLNHCQAGLRLKLDACRFEHQIQLEDGSLTLLSLEGSHCPGLYADRLMVKGSVFLSDQAAFTGEVRLLGAEIGGDLSCIGSAFTHPDGAALSADGLKVKGSVFLREGCEFTGLLDFTNATVEGHFIMCGISRMEWSLRLSHTRVGVLWDDQESWPKPGELWLDGFHYGRLDEKAEWDLAARLDWLSRHGNSGRFNPQPYEQLAAVYREAGFERRAREVLIAKNKQRLGERRSCLPSLRKLAESWPGRPRSLQAVLPWLFTTFPVWLGKSRGPCRSVAAYWLMWLFGKICAFGYKPWWAAAWWFGLWAVTWRVVSLMAEGGWLVPTLVDMHASKLKPIDFTSSGFSFDLLTPIFDMGYLSAWTPENNAAALILLVLGTIGYILVALFAASITGLIRK